MKFKKNVLKVAVAALVLSSGVYAQENGWGDVAGSDTAEVGGWSTPAAEAPAPAPAAPQAEPGKLACGTDDPRYATLVPVLKSLQAGEKIEPMQTSFPTYVTLSQNVRGILGDNIFISSPDCTEQYLFNGELTGKINVPFTDLWQVINDAMRTDDLPLMQFVAKNTRAAPESALSVISMVQFVHLDDAQVRKLYSVIAPDKVKALDIRKPLMLEIYLAYGGTVAQADRGKAAFVSKYGAYSVDGIYLARREGVFETGNLTFENASLVVPSLLKTAGLEAQAIPNGRVQQMANQ